MQSELFTLTGKTAMITGASRGIGRSIALAFAGAGADLALVSRTRGDLETVAAGVRELGRRALPLACDVSQAAQVQTTVEAALAEYGRIDVLVNSAGISPVYKRAEQTAEAEWDQVLAVNLKGMFLCSQVVGRTMLKQKSGRIISISSIGGQVGLPRLVAYCAAKGGIEQVTKVLALEWADRGIQVNAIAPAYVETDLTRGLRENPRLAEGLLRQTPLGRFARPADIIGAALFLASEAGAYVTGTTLLVDGGWTAG
ncbi:MAG: glucose 1-dehydrogenase [Bacteroidetes bacterium]|nr:glucose 1-dehydrogenase [Bacteroidota bacterium]MCL5025182.1 glucose 1-dehydrogenase [Chloroflexota bacterium]